jgi:hypothetical protein
VEYVKPWLPAIGNEAHHRFDPVVLFEMNALEIVELAARHKIPAIYSGQRFVALGGLMSYNADLVVRCCFRPRWAAPST